MGCVLSPPLFGRCGCVFGAKSDISGSFSWAGIKTPTTQRASRALQVHHRDGPVRDASSKGGVEEEEEAEDEEGEDKEEKGEEEDKGRRQLHCRDFKPGEKFQVSCADDDEEEDKGSGEGGGATWRSAEVIHAAKWWVHVAYLTGGGGKADVTVAFRARFFRRGAEEPGAQVGGKRGQPPLPCCAPGGESKRTRISLS